MPGDFDESKHRRAEDGKFTDGPGGEGGPKAERSPKAKELAQRVKTKRGGAKKAAAEEPQDAARVARRESIRAVREQLIAAEAASMRDHLEHQRRRAQGSEAPPGMPKDVAERTARYRAPDEELRRQGKHELTDEQIAAEADKASRSLAEKFDLVESEWDRLEPPKSDAAQKFEEAQADLRSTLTASMQDVEASYAAARSALDTYSGIASRYQSALGDDADEEDEHGYRLDEEMSSLRSEFGIEDPPQPERTEADTEADDKVDYGPPEEPEEPVREDYPNVEEYDEAMAEHAEAKKAYPAERKAYEKRLAALEKERRTAAATAAQAVAKLVEEQEAAVARIKAASKAVSKAERKAEREADIEPGDLIRKGAYDPKAIDEDSDSFDPDAFAAYERTYDAASALVDIEERRVAGASLLGSDRSAEISALREVSRAAKRTAKNLAGIAKGAKPRAPDEIGEEPEADADADEGDEDEDEE